MNWTQFFLTLFAIYAIYYLLNVLFDILKPKSQIFSSSEQEELTFYEDNVPEVVAAGSQDKEEVQEDTPIAESRKAISSGLLQSTGGVNLKQLFSLAQSDLIEFTKAIPY